MVTRDADLRSALRHHLGRESVDPSTRVIEELGIDEGVVRIDVAVVNGQLHGYEIKSDRDTLDRLPDQASVYSAVFDQVVLVTAARHYAQARTIVPRWWGLVVGRIDAHGSIELVRRRSPKLNRRIDPRVLARLLWRSEALGLLESRGAAKGYRSKSREHLYSKLLDLLTLDELRCAVRDTLKQREGWRSGAGRRRGDGAFRRAATPQGCPTSSSSQRTPPGACRQR